jgi:hypothetical protein
MNKTLDKIYSLGWFNGKVTVECNLCMEIDDYSFIWDIVDKYKL